MSKLSIRRATNLAHLVENIKLDIDSVKSTSLESVLNGILQLFLDETTKIRPVPSV